MALCVGVGVCGCVGGGGACAAGSLEFAPLCVNGRVQLWWAHEVLHRNVMLDFARRIVAFAGARDAVEASLLRRARAAAEGSPSDRSRLSGAAWEEAAAAERGWIAAVRACDVVRPCPWYHR